MCYIGVGKTSLLVRFADGTFESASTTLVESVPQRVGEGVDGVFVEAARALVAKIQSLE